MKPSTHLRCAAVGLALAAVLPAAYADAGNDQPSQSSRQSNAGAATGLVVGALAAGPVGAVVGAVAGVVLGDRYHREQQAAAGLSHDLEHSEAERERLARSVAQLDGALAQAQARDAALEGAMTEINELGLDVSFRTEEDAVAAQALPPLLKLGALAAVLPQAQVRVAGYADARGSDAFNDALSLRRAQCVAAVLIHAGVPAERIVIEAHGRSAARIDGGADDQALDRRVTVRLIGVDADRVARRE